MKIFFVDDSNISIDKKLEFFIYGGLIIGEKDVRGLVKFLYDLKKENRIEQNRPIKWDNKKWRNEEPLNPGVHKKIKEKILKFIGQFPCKIVIYLAPHDFYHIIRGKKKKEGGIRFKFVIDPEKQKRALEYALNICHQKFNLLLREEKDLGLIFADDFDGGALKDYLKDHCFKMCLTGTEKSPLECITYPLININSDYSPAHQINDVVLGAIQFSLKEISFNFLPIIKKNFWEKDKEIIGYGFNVYPKKTNNPLLKEKLQKIEGKFKRLTR